MGVVDELNLHAVSQPLQGLVLEAVYERCTRAIEEGAPEEVPSAHLLRGRVSLVRKDYEAAAKDFAAAAASEGPVMFAAARELTLIDRYRADDPLIPGLATGSEIVAQFLARRKTWWTRTLGRRRPDPFPRAIESWYLWCESHGLDLLRVGSEDFIPWLVATFSSYSPRVDALHRVDAFYAELAEQGYIESSPRRGCAPSNMARLATQMAEGQRVGAEQQQQTSM